MWTELNDSSDWYLIVAVKKSIPNKMSENVGIHFIYQLDTSTMHIKQVQVDALWRNKRSKDTLTLSTNRVNIFKG